MNELNEKVARLCGVDQFVIIKRGLYYRPNAHGYTNCLSKAWKLPQAEAKKYEMYADNPDVPGCEKVLIKPAPIPDYCNDLNACVEFEKPFEDDCAIWTDYMARLVGKPWHFDWAQDEVWRAVHATAEQRCLAFVAVMEASSVGRGTENQGADQVPQNSAVPSPSAKDKQETLEE